MSVRQRSTGKSESCFRWTARFDPRSAFRLPDGTAWRERLSRRSSPPKSAILALGAEVRRQCSRDLRQPSSYFVQTWSRAGVAESCPETLGELGIGLTMAHGAGSWGDQQQHMLIFR